ncbi:MAG: hypothetical protein FJY85_02780, partial [Deltaproteobacteria bacterium]|nr:hypothetical protein [Deltaproteobacteria bacterium]
MAVVSDEVFGGRVVRTLGWAGLIDRVLMTSLPLIAIAFILNVPQYLNLRVWAEQYLALFLGFILVSIFLSRPASPNAPQDKVPWYDVVLAIASAATSGFVVIAWEQIVTEGSLITPGRVVLAIAAIVTIMEGTRRLFGWTLVILVGLFIFYGLFTELFPGPFYGKG